MGCTAHRTDAALSCCMPVREAVSERIDIRELTSADRVRAVEVVNAAADWYREFIPQGELHSPEMDEAGWEAEAQRMTWWGAFAEGELVGVMGSEPAREVVLLRHAYVLPLYQRQGVASLLLAHIEARLPRPSRLVAGTYRDNYKARGNLEKAGFSLSTDPVTVLRTYYEIPEDRLRTSVTYEKKLDG